MMNAAMTGATGFLGQTILRLLTSRGARIRALVRRPTDQVRLQAMGVEAVLGDLTRPGGCDGLVEAGDVVFHAAARVEVTGPWSWFRQTMIEGTRRLLEHALPKQPNRFVYVSSAAVYAPSALQGQPISAEWTPVRPARYNFYARAKAEAERIVRTECDRAGCSWVILRPVFIYGPGWSTLVRNVIHMARHKRLFRIGDGSNRIATIYVDDAARAIISAGTHPKAAGKIYDVTSDEEITQKTFLEATADALGIPCSWHSVPRQVAFTAAFVADQIARTRITVPPTTRATVALMSADQRVDATRLRQELGWEPLVSFAEGTRRTKQWYAKQRFEKEQMDTTTATEGKKQAT